MRALKVAVIAEQAVSKAGLFSLLRQSKNINVWHKNLDKSNWQKLLNRRCPHAILVDLTSMDGDEIRLLRKIRAQFPDIRFIGLIDLYRDWNHVQWSSMGINALLPKSTTIDELQEAIDTVLDHGYYCCEKTMDLLVREVLMEKNMLRQQSTVPFAQKEKEVLEMICKDQSNLDIAEELYMSHRTVEGYKKRIKEKLGTRSIVGAAVKAVKNGWVTI